MSWKPRSNASAFCVHLSFRGNRDTGRRLRPRSSGNHDDERRYCMSGRFENRVVFVTGSGRGFGAALALAFAREGADLVVHYNSSGAGAEEVAKEVRGLGRASLTVQGDIASWGDV